MATKKNKTPINLHSLNRDLLKAPAVIKRAHIDLAENNRLVIGPEWVSNGRWYVRREAIHNGVLLSPEWLRYKEIAAVAHERNLLLDAIFGVRAGRVSYQVIGAEVEAKVVAGFAPGIKKAQKLTRTRATYSTDWQTYIVFATEKWEKVVGVDARWADLFALSHVWRFGDDSLIYDHPDASRATVILTDKGQLPEESSFAAFMSGFADFQKIRKGGKA